MNPHPVWPGYFADPFVLRHEGVYYAYGTGGPIDHGLQSDGRMFPLLRSTDLVHWEHLGGALIPLGDPARRAYWAPEVAERDGRFFLYYSAGGEEGEEHRIRVAASQTPAGPFEDCGVEVIGGEPFSIDAHPFKDPADGSWYLFFAKDFLEDEPYGTGTAVVRLSDDMMHEEGVPHTVLRASAEWHVYERNRFWYGRTWPVWNTVEGPFVVCHDRRYYCFYSGGRWSTPDYGVSFGVADNVLGPYTEGCPDHACVLKCIPGLLDGPGHNSITIAPDGAERIVYHAWNPQRTARRMHIDPLVWTPDGPRA